MAQTKTFTAWSYSRWKLYDECPFKAKLKNLDKIPEPASTALENGKAVHEGLEHYIKGITAKLPKEYPLDVFGALYKDLRKKRSKNPQSVVIEGEWAFRADWTECGWFDSDCWLRVKVDCAAIARTADTVDAVVLDWKTGKFWAKGVEEYKTQLDLYALAVLLKFRDVKNVTVTPALVYVDHGIRHEVGTYTMADLPRLQKEWALRAKPMLADKKFAPKPGSRCKWCSYSADKNGPCKF